MGTLFIIICLLGIDYELFSIADEIRAMRNTGYIVLKRKEELKNDTNKNSKKL